MNPSLYWPKQTEVQQRLLALALIEMMYKLHHSLCERSLIIFS